MRYSTDDMRNYGADCQFDFGVKFAMKEAADEIDRLRAALLPFANARTKEGWFGTVPDSQAWVEARLALGLPWEPSIPQPATISTDN